jgi:hypothetical protein
MTRRYLVLLPATVILVISWAAHWREQERPELRMATHPRPLSPSPLELPSTFRATYISQIPKIMLSAGSRPPEWSVLSGALAFFPMT